jgi:protocatechuate 3,4-dioxygenase beta subunit
MLTHAKNLLQRIARRKPKPSRRAAAETPRLRGFEIMEPRQLLAADPLYVGAVYIEEDIGSDLHGDTFELTFEGGAEGTQLSRVAIRTDQNLPGLSGGDLIFDTVEGGLGADHAFPFTLVVLQTADPQASVRATAEDGGMLLVLDLTGFHAGDKLVFTIDVDEVQGFDPEEVDFDAINESIDPLASGVEFQGSRLTATFLAPHFHEAEATGEFRNRYDAALAGTGLNLPADDAGGKRDRTTGAVGQTQQQPLPILISGKVFLETDLDLQQDAGEPGLAGVALTLWQLDDGTYRSTGHATTTDAQGRYLFGLGLNLQPGVYQVRETQPDGLFSVGAVPGSVAGEPAGRTVTGDRDLLTDIAVPLGGTHAVDFDFAEAAPAELSGYVYHDRDNDGRRDPGEEGLSGVQIVISALDRFSPQSPVTVTTDSYGHYVVRGLAPGVYRVVERAQPAGYLDGLDAAGTVAGQVRGRAQNPGDALEEISLGGGQAGVEYNFGELVPASIQGRVCVADRFGDCVAATAARVPLADATVRLLDATGQVLAETKTDADGRYRFTGLRPGTYAVAEITPAGLIDGDEHLGTVEGRAVGRVIADGTLGEITLASSQQAIDYDFCEYLPARLSGYVYHDRDNDGLRETGEEGLANVPLRLLDEAGQPVASTTTDAQGFYQFVFLPAGVYAAVQTHPAGWVDGRDRAGAVGGQTVGQADQPGDRIGQVALWWGDEGVDYNFGEFHLASIRGSVHLTGPDGDCYTPGGPQPPLADVLVRLLDAAGAPLAETRTDAQGNYRFDGLLPGTYTVAEQTPGGLIDGPDRVGTVDGRPLGAMAGNDTIGGIRVTSGQAAMDYDFCEHAPASLSGTVYHDRNNDGRYNAGEEPLAGITVRLLDATGQVVATTQTGQDGSYEFRDLRAGQYAVAESQPAGYLDGLDAAGTVAGTTVGRAVNPGDEIRGIGLRWGDAGQRYDFGELLSGSIQGLVFSDLDRDCRLDPEEQPLAGVTVELRDGSGRVVASTQTDGQGKYRFADLAPGSYTLWEQQPAGYFQGGQRAGSGGGDASLEDTIRDIAVGSGRHLTDYDFCEVPPSSLTGRVHLDPNQNCLFDAGEQPLAGVVIRLLDSSGQVLAETTTDAEGRYRFDQLRPGTYAVQEIQAGGYFHGGQRAGSHGGNVAVADVISEVLVPAGQALTDYDFCELPSSSLEGVVHLDPDQDCQWDAGEQPLAGVAIRLLDSNGRVVAETTTGADGRYRFDQLRPGQYAVQEIQPRGYFHGGQRVGSHGGDAGSADWISGIQVPAGQALTDYDFCELPAARLSGYVFQDGELIRTLDGLPPSDIWEKHDGRRIPDDRPLADVVLALRDAQTGLPVSSDRALPGTYPSGVITVQTDARGYYEFLGLPPGTYDVIEIQPPRLRDGLDTPGSTGGTAFNPNSAVDPQLRVGRGDYPLWDAIVSIPLGAGVHSQENNFSEVALGIEGFTLPPNIPNPVPEPPAPPSIDVLPPAPRPWIVPAPLNEPLRFGTRGTGGMQDFSWHLSVIDAGSPRGQGDPVPLAGLRWRSVTFHDVTDWYGRTLDQGRWTLGTRIGAESSSRAAREFVFGDADSIPIAGDFNGDGIDEIGVYSRGHFFLDLNGNGCWDDEDLWARLGNELDFPVTGDWNGDGKDDIGIFGPAWPGDPQALEIESGLPDLRNQVLALPKPKNVPPKPEDATSGLRLLRHTAAGTTRADVIDHVFRYGAGAQIPVTGDWSGDGIKNIGVFRDGQWRLDANGDGRWSEEDRTFQYGQAGDLPVVGDFDGDGIDEIGVYRGGQWIVDIDGNHELNAHDAVFNLGGPGDLPVAGDWNGDGTDDPGVYHPSNSAAPAADAS